MRFERGVVGDLAEVIMGQSPPSEQTNKSGVGIPLLNGPTEFGQFHPAPVQWTTFAPKEAQTDDVLFCVRGSTTGRMNRADGPYAIGRGLAAIRGATMSDSGFVEYALRHSRDELLAGVTGSTFPNLSRVQLSSHPIPIPSEAVRRSIAEVLGALDGKIAANTRLVDTALQLADAHFLDAAAYAPLSGLTFADTADVGGGGTPRTKVEEYWGDEIHWATPTDVTALHGPYLTATSRRITQAGLDNCSSALYPTGSILMTSRATIGAFAVAQSPMAVNQGFIVVNSKGDVPQWWLFHEMKRRVPEFVSHANGATFLELSRGKFKNFHVHLATTNVMQRFAETAGALHNRAAAAEKESAWLADTRDALLPLLMSGRVTVKDAESVVEGVA